MDLRFLKMQDKGDQIEGGTPPQKELGGEKGNQGGTAPQEEKTLTQEQVNAIIDARFAKVSAKHEEELAEIQKQLKEAKASAEAANKEKELILRKNKIRALGVDEEFIDYVLQSVESDDELEAFIEGKPKLLTATYQTVQSNPPYTGGSVQKAADLIETEDSIAYVKARREEEQQNKQ